MIALLFVLIIYGLIEMLKMFIKSKLYNFIPIFSACLGIICALLTYIFQPDLLPTSGFLTIIIFGLFCGLSSVGLHQILKHLEKEIVTKTKRRQKATRPNKEQTVITLKDIQFDKSTQTIQTKENNTNNKNSN